MRWETIQVGLNPEPQVTYKVSCTMGQLASGSNYYFHVSAWSGLPDQSTRSLG